MFISCISCKESIISYVTTVLRWRVQEYHTPGVTCDCNHVLTRSWLNLAAICAHMVHTGSRTSSASRTGNASLHRCMQYLLTSQRSLNSPQHLSAMDATSLSSDSWPTVRTLAILSIIIISEVFSCIHKQCSCTLILTIIDINLIQLWSILANMASHVTWHF